MLTDHQRLVLDQLDHGAYFNVLHTEARELIAAGLAREDFGYLAITEAGRRAIRQPTAHTHRIISEHVADLGNATYVGDPMANPQERYVLPDIAPEEPRELPPAKDELERALRAAGEASGKTGVWPETEWVHAFVGAFINASTRNDKLET
jgi:hypothetical protein